MHTFVMVGKSNKKLNVLVTSPTKRHTCPISVLNGLLKSKEDIGVYVLNSDQNRSRNYSNPKIREFIQDSIDAPIEPIFENGDNFKYVKQLDEAIKNYNIDLVIPTSERSVKILAAYDKYDKYRFVADNDIIDLLQDKFKTYNFINKHMSKSNVRTPRHISTSGSSFNDIDKFIKNEGEVFVKPAHAKSGGGVGMGFVKSLDELVSKFPDLDKKNYVISEKLFLPEISHTLLVSGRKIIAQSSAESIEKIGFSASKRLRSVKKYEIEKFTNDLFEKISEAFPGNIIDGPYNIDFLFSKDKNEIVLSEVNPGRLPGGLDVAIKSGINYPEMIVKLFCGESIDDSDYKGGVESLIY